MSYRPEVYKAETYICVTNWYLPNKPMNMHNILLALEMVTLCICTHS